jgi:hypothetical protein
MPIHPAADAPDKIISFILKDVQRIDTYNKFRMSVRWRIKGRNPRISKRADERT